MRQAIVIVPSVKVEGRKILKIKSEIIEFVGTRMIEESNADAPVILLNNELDEEDMKRLADMFSTDNVGNEVALIFIDMDDDGTNEPYLHARV